MKGKIMAVNAVTDGDFQAEVLDSDKPVVVDFWAEWCGPCKAIGPALDEISGEMSEAVKIVKMDVDSNYDTVGKYGISAMPTLVIFKGGAEIARHRGSTTKSNLTSWIESSINAG